MTGRQSPPAKRRESFDEGAARYHRARPRYPVELFDRWERLSGLSGAVGDVLEVGPATGVATEVLAERGHRVHAVELGPALAAKAVEVLASFPSVTITCADFETWQPPKWGAFDAVVAATMWHWLDPQVRCRLAHQHLRPGGTLAVWSALHVVPEGGDPFFAELQEVYDAFDLSGPDDHVFPAPGELPTYETEIEASGLFEMVEVAHFDWEIIYDATTYIDLLSTFSGHFDMTPRQRDGLYGAIRTRLAARADGLLRRHWGAALHVARSLG